jgi:cellulose synthase/poly-beta-1,6-N-acetylglucosamine synthase-like glycosyltransferase
MKISISIGIPAYNEEKNIGRLLTAILTQRTCSIEIDQIVIVSSGSTDRTDIIVEDFAGKDDRIVLIRQRRREGKASAVNEFLKVAKNEVLVLESADTIPEQETIEKLCRPFIDEKVGMTGAHPIPTNNDNCFIGYASHLVWNLHHQIALKTPKCGELIAFRKIFDSIPTDTAVDEAWIEYEISKKGYKILYVPEAIVYNRGPETVRDYIKQRRRIACGHLDLTKRVKYKVSSQNFTLLLRALLEVFPLSKPSKWPYFFGAVTLEGISRLLGYYDYVSGKSHVIWDIVESTKKV